MNGQPFLGSKAIRAGLLTAHELETKYRAVFRNVYLANEVALTPLLRARAAWLFAGPDAVLSGVSAAAVHGTKWLDVNAPAEVVRTNRHTPHGLRARSYALAPEDVCERDGMRVTTVARTALVDADGGAETPLQTRTRLKLSYIGIPGLETQIPFYDQWGMVCNRVAMGWRRWQVAVECDEEQDSPGYRTWVHSQTAELESFGWVVVWVTQSMVTGRSNIVERVRQKVWAAQDRIISARRAASGM